MATSAFPIHPTYTAIALAYKNKAFIADEVMPRVRVGTEEFTYYKWDTDNFKIPDLTVGRTSMIQRDNISATELSSKTADYALEIPVPQKDIDQAPAGLDPLGAAAERIAAKLATAREKRVADIVFNAANYKATTNKATLSSTSQWSHADSDPIKAILEAMDGMLVRPNIMVVGRQVYTALMRHPKLVAASHGNSGLYGLAGKSFLADLFELQDIYVGEAFIDSTKKGQTQSMARCWGKHAALLYRETGATVGTMTYGFTAQFNDRVAMQWEDRNIGLYGGKMIRVGESVKELMTANDLGYLFTDAAA
jgi:hypothetical protein